MWYHWVRYKKRREAVPQKPVLRVTFEEGRRREAPVVCPDRKADCIQLLSQLL